MATNKDVSEFFKKPTKKKLIVVTHKLFFDGGSRGNPGPGGSGYALFDGDIEIGSGAFPMGVCTNNEAEYMGVIKGLELALQMGISNISVYGDSLLVINQIQGLWRCKAKNLLPYLTQARNLVRKFSRITLQHVPREQNKRADELSNDAMDQVELNR